MKDKIELCPKCDCAWCSKVKECGDCPGCGSLNTVRCKKFEIRDGLTIEDKIRAKSTV